MARPASARCPFQGGRARSPACSASMSLVRRSGRGRDTSGVRGSCSTTAARGRAAHAAPPEPGGDFALHRRCAGPVRQHQVGLDRVVVHDRRPRRPRAARSEHVLDLGEVHLEPADRSLESSRRRKDPHEPGLRIDIAKRPWCAASHPTSGSGAGRQADVRRLEQAQQDVQFPALFPDGQDRGKHHRGPDTCRTGRWR